MPPPCVSIRFSSTWRGPGTGCGSPLRRVLTDDGLDVARQELAHVRDHHAVGELDHHDAAVPAIVLVCDRVVQRLADHPGIVLAESGGVSPPANGSAVAVRRVELLVRGICTTHPRTCDLHDSRLSVGDDRQAETAALATAPDGPTDLEAPAARLGVGSAHERDRTPLPMPTCATREVAAQEVLQRCLLGPRTPLHRCAPGTPAGTLARAREPAR